MSFPPSSNNSSHGGAASEGTPSSLRALDTLGRFLEQDGWHPQRVEGHPFYRMGFNGKNGSYVCFAQIMLKLDQMLFYASMPLNVPENARPGVAEFITRSNYGLRIGTFEIDFSYGEVRYKSSLDFEGQELTPNLIRNAIIPAVLTIDRYAPGLMSVIYGGRSPLQAINDVEQQPSS